MEHYCQFVAMVSDDRDIVLDTVRSPDTTSVLVIMMVMLVVVVVDIMMLS